MAAGETKAGQLDDHIGAATSQSEAANALADAPRGGETRLLAVPVPIVDPTLGNGLALVGLLTFAADNAAATTPRSTLGAAAAKTDTGSWLIGAGARYYSPSDRYRMGGSGGYGALYLDYYGISSNSPFFDHPVGFKVDGTAFSADMQVRVAENLYLGAIARRVDASVSLDSEIDQLNALTAKFDLIGLGPLASYDTRDSTWYPSLGALGTFQLLRYGTEIGSDESFLSLNVSLTSELILAGNLRAAKSGQNAPFFMYPYIAIRGFPAGRYLNQTVTQAQAELRWMFADRIGVVTFLGAGVAAPDFTSPGQGSRAYGLGAGLRYQISRKDKMNVGLDLAYGSDDEVAVYFRVGEAF
jgi:hypothetical protein